MTYGNAVQLHATDYMVGNGGKGAGLFDPRVTVSTRRVTSLS